MTQDLQQVRSELRRLGYLSHSYDRYLLQDALRPRQPLRTLGQLTLKVALAGGTLFALVLAFALAAVNGNLVASPFDLIALFLHLLPATGGAIGLGFLLLCALLVLVLRFYPVRRIEVLSFGVALLSGLLVAAVASWRLLELWSGSERWTALIFSLVLPLAVYALIRLVETGLLTLAIRLTELTPRVRSFSRRWIAATVLVALALITLPVVLSVRGHERQEPAHLPTAGGERVLLVGVDGVLAAELDYLLARGALPAMAALLDDGGVLEPYRRPPAAPAVFWTTVATGLDAGGHGVTSVDSFRPAGVATPLARTGPLRFYWRWVSVPLGLTEYRPVLANRRHAFTLWELAARGGRPVSAVNWWSTYPAEPLPGLVVAHGAYQLLQDEAHDAVASESRPDLIEWAAAGRKAIADSPVRPGSKEKPSSMESIVQAALPAESRQTVLDKAVLPDRFYLQALEHSLTFEPRVAALYLPAPDLAADGWPGGDIALSDLVRAHLQEVDALLAAHARDFGTVALFLDPGRRGAAPERRGGVAGRVLLWRREGGCRAAGLSSEASEAAEASEALSPQAVTAGLSLALGLPASEELPAPPAVCAWPAARDHIPSFGRRRPLPPPAALDSEEYLRNLRSLGYL
ncbi:MAG: alkaline phosphatase family protein [Acidobacteriota bacterium]|nr:alkaline phosphatase family protein [Acidobacteriota bacterium]